MPPYIPNTPESLLQRSDSKNPETTCRGLGASGRPCRRSLAKSLQVSPSPSPRRKLSSSPARTPGPEEYCWQHKDQAASQFGASTQGKISAGCRERTSVDTLVDRLGLLDVKEQKQGKRRKPLPRPASVESRVEVLKPERPKARPKPASNLGLFCCVGVADERRQAPRPVNHNSGRTNVPAPTKVTKVTSSLPVKYKRPSINRDPSSRTGEFLSLIPTSASPQLTAQLLAELARPVSELDKEGYIYMFWLTSESIPVEPPSDTASSLLSPPAQRMPGQRRTSDVLNTFATTVSDANKKTILLKIGRAQNVYRRLNQWTQQCGYNLSLIRYYPYQPSVVSGANVNKPPSTPRKVPNANKVERLIHIELNAQRAIGHGKCKACGREHREWFEVNASTNGVKAVDEVIRRWVDWGERNPGS
ncbi:hypothetical protein QTJ16_000907 [Diplocarpon rosae]|uniref:Bacteriophage T5 Orf172 DNA-binding domain-containing protein n=1 Tax=Diplocarpon rosae TaxID=946125 RepID=A0AAD9T6R4_9HELO|nr:hypothetical protein QTJ16_000907 [Diplocarpon rosae]